MKPEQFLVKTHWILTGAELYMLSEGALLSKRTCLFALVSLQKVL